MASPNEAFLLDFDHYFGGGNTWQASLMQQIYPLTTEQASWKPAPDRHAIWDIVMHVNFWKEYMIALMNGATPPDQETGNWSLAPHDATEEKWKNELARTRSIHEDLRTIIVQMGDTLFDPAQHRANLIRQIILHDAYHAGQIGLLRVLQGLKPVE